MTTGFPNTSRNQVRRHPERGRYDAAEIYPIVDAALICDLPGFVLDDQPYVIPTLHARQGDSILLHGARASRMLQHVAAGGELCITVTLLDGIVLARSISATQSTTARRCCSAAAPPDRRPRRADARAGRFHRAAAARPPARRPAAQPSRAAPDHDCRGTDRKRLGQSAQRPARTMPTTGAAGLGGKRRRSTRPLVRLAPDSQLAPEIEVPEAAARIWQGTLGVAQSCSSKTLSMSSFSARSAENGDIRKSSTALPKANHAYCASIKERAEQ